MKPGGAMYPSHARIFLAPMRSDHCRKKEADFQDSCGGWAEFVDVTRENFGVDMSVLTAAYEKEQAQYLLETGVWSDIKPQVLLGEPAVLAAYDLNTVTIADIQANPDPK